MAQDKANGGILYRHLRQGHKRYRKGRSCKRSVILNPVSIDERPAIVDERSRLGDWEVDTVQGKQGSGAIVSLVERKSLLYLVQYVPAKRHLTNLFAQSMTQPRLAGARPRYRRSPH